MNPNYSFLQVKQVNEQVVSSIEQTCLRDLNEGEVAVKVAYSDINYKDALALKTNGGVIRQYPMTPGIDLAGTVLASKDSQWQVGQKVLQTGYSLGVSAPGGFSQIQIVKGDELVALPDDLEFKQAMQFGTAGFTAALAVLAIKEQVTDLNAPIVITGASGGVGSIAVGLLARLGFKNLIALSRKEAPWLINLGATTIENPNLWLPEKIKPLAKQKIAGVIDTVGGDLLSALIPQVQYAGALALCGNASGIKLQTTVLPFILRGIKIIGIDSVNVQMPKRIQVWVFLSNHRQLLDKLPINEITLEQIPEVAQQLLAGQHQGRTIIHIGEA